MTNPSKYYDLLRRPHVTEKTTVLQELRNQLAFEVAPDANKSEVKKAIEALFQVKVVKVNIVKQPGKRRRTFGRPGHTRPWKKALVTLREGDTIDVA
ncbi:MAG: 50S ribosomal protein L23 [Planctomycetota bacterium]